MLLVDRCQPEKVVQALCVHDGRAELARVVKGTVVTHQVHALPGQPPGEIVQGFRVQRGNTGPHVHRPKAHSGAAAKHKPVALRANKAVLSRHGLVQPAQVKQRLPVQWIQGRLPGEIAGIRQARKFSRLELAPGLKGFRGEQEGVEAGGKTLPLLGQEAQFKGVRTALQPDLAQVNPVGTHMCDKFTGVRECNITATGAPNPVIETPPKRAMLPELAAPEVIHPRCGNRNVIPRKGFRSPSISLVREPVPRRKEVTRIRKSLRGEPCFPGKIGRRRVFPFPPHK